jgi:outer membrane PBP1 activator LpoA protein
MHVAASEERHAELEKLLGAPLTFVPRARGDVDAIVAMVTPLEASALIPALKFHSADRVPVYTTSQTIRGVPADRLSELAGFHVTELPWLSMNDGSYRSLEQAFSLDGSPFVSLYALGVDAFRLADRAPLIVDGRFTALLGSTGELTFSANGRIQRRLARTIVEGARLVPNRGSAVGR